tara:strand:- start:226 stop:375 length:150 start_codon:yes stop_codon:yes gene_type:complete
MIADIRTVPFRGGHLGGDPRFSRLTLAYIPPGGLSTVRTIVLTLRAAAP